MGSLRPDALVNVVQDLIVQLRNLSCESSTSLLMHRHGWSAGSGSVGKSVGACSCSSRPDFPVPGQLLFSKVSS